MVPETRYARSGDVHIAYQVVGEGPFDLVVVPGPFPTWSTSGRRPQPPACCAVWPRSPG